MKFSQFQLRFDIAQIQFRMQAKAIEFGQFLGRVKAALPKRGKQIKIDRRKILKFDAQKKDPPRDGFRGHAVVELILSARTPTHFPIFARLKHAPAILLARTSVKRTTTWLCA